MPRDSRQTIAGRVWFFLELAFFFTMLHGIEVNKPHWC
jgi:hypothetical protein